MQNLQSAVPSQEQSSNSQSRTPTQSDHPSPVRHALLNRHSEVPSQEQTSNARTETHSPSDPPSRDAHSTDNNGFHASPKSSSRIELYSSVNGLSSRAHALESSGRTTEKPSRCGTHLPRHVTQETAEENDDDGITRCICEKHGGSQ